MNADKSSKYVLLDKLNEVTQIFEKILVIFRKMKAHPYSACAAALYAAAQAGILGLGMSEENFLSIAKEIFADTQKQLKADKTTLIG